MTHACMMPLEVTTGSPWECMTVNAEDKPNPKPKPKPNPNPNTNNGKLTALESTSLWTATDLMPILRQVLIT